VASVEELEPVRFPEPEPIPEELEPEDNRKEEPESEEDKNQQPTNEKTNGELSLFSNDDEP